MTRTHPHARDLAVSRRALSRFAYREVKQREQVEHIGQCGVQSVIVDCVVVPYLIKSGHWIPRSSGGLQWLERHNQYCTYTQEWELTDLA